MTDQTYPVPAPSDASIFATLARGDAGARQHVELLTLWMWCAECLVRTDHDYDGKHYTCRECGKKEVKP